MRAVLQRVTGAAVHVDGKIVSRIGPGIVALIGIGVDDTTEEIAPLSQKILQTKLWNEGMKAKDIHVPTVYRADESVEDAPMTATTTIAQNTGETASRSEQVWGGKPWKTNVIDLEGEVLCISQFTLHARLSKGTKPDFHKSMTGSEAKVIYTRLLEHLRQNYQAERIKDGAFGEMMQCSLTNDVLDTAVKK